MASEIELPVFFESIAPSYLADRRSELPELQSLIEARDFATVESAFHKLSGSGGSFGFKELSVLAKTVERAAQQEDPVVLATEFENYAAHIRDVQLIFRD